MATNPVVVPTSHDPDKTPVIPLRQARHWIEPWYVSYGILGALASGLAVILIPLLVVNAGGSATEIGGAIAAQNVGALMSPFWGSIADRTRAYRGIFSGGFVLLALGFIGFGTLQGSAAWLVSAFLIGFGTAASNTVASLFVVEFTPKEEWGARISWLQTFNAAGSVAGMALAGWFSGPVGALISSALVVPALLLGGVGLPIPGSRFHRPQPHLRHEDLATLVRRIEPMTASVVMRIHHPSLHDLAQIGNACETNFGIFLVSWFFFSLSVSSFSSLYPVLMQHSFGMAVSSSASLMSAATLASVPLYNFSGRFTTRHGPVSALVIGMSVRGVVLAGLGVVALVHPGSATLLAVVLFALFQGIWPLLSVAANDLAAALAPFSQGTAVGLFNASAAIASAVGAVLGGAIATYLGYAVVSLLAAVGLVIALFFILPLAKHKPVAPPHPVSPKSPG